jgi:hypothetical protein
MTKQIIIQTQGVQSPIISQAKPIGWCALNFDNIKIVIDAYNGSGASAIPRTDSLIQIIDDKEVHEMTPETLLTAIRFFERYNEMGKDVVRFKNVFHVIPSDRYKSAVNQAERGLRP